MILVDTPVWIDHLHEPNEHLAFKLETKRVFCHPLVVGEIAMGSLKNRAELLSRLDRLKTIPSATLAETRTLIEKQNLFATGIGLVDAMLLASCLLDPRIKLWTRDRRLHAQASRFGIAYQPLH